MSILKLDKIPGKILVVKPSALGDIVHSLPFLSSLKDRFPDAAIDWVVARGLHNILEDHPLIRRLWVIDKDQWKKLPMIGVTLSSLKSLFGELRREKYDLVIDLQGLFRSGIISWATRAEYRVGFSEAREGSPLFYTHRVRGGQEIHAIERYLKVAAFLGCDTNSLRYVFPPLPTGSPTIRALPPDYVVIAPSSGNEAKTWPAHRFGEVAARLPFPSVVVAGKADEFLAREVAETSRGHALSLAGKTNLKELLAVIRGARFLISGDTGPMHIAAAFGVPVFTVFGPTNPLRTGPYGKIHTVIREDLPCSPCYRRKKCDHWLCMESVTVEKMHQSVSRGMPGVLKGKAAEAACWNGSYGG